MENNRLKSFNVSLLILGIFIAGLWIYLTGGGNYLGNLVRVNPGYIILLAAITAFCVFVRFIRWQFLLRRIGVRVPTRRSLSIFLASLLGIITPAYVGEVIRAPFMWKEFGIPIRITITVLIIERLFDVAVLGIIGAATANNWWIRCVMVLVVAAAFILCIVGFSYAQRARVPSRILLQLHRGRTILLCLLISFLAWIPATLIVTLTAASLNSWITPFDGIRIFSTSTILGGITLMPAGVGSTGSIAILEIQALGFPLAQSVAVVSIIRLTSTGFAIGMGAVFLFRELKILKHDTSRNRSIHFNEIAQEYDEQFSDHIWKHLLDRKVKLITKALPNPSSAAGLGLDLGCGLGQHCIAMSKLGYRVIGIDVAEGLAQKAKTTGVKVIIGNAFKLPFQDSIFDFVYAVGVLHHLPGQKAQDTVYREALRILKPGGWFIAHETNPRNPLFRFYMGYIFPIFRNIDEGTEWWIAPQRWKKVEGMELAKLQHFTFLPDLIPRWLMRPFKILERRLEASLLRPYSVHYMAVLKKK